MKKFFSFVFFAFLSSNIFAQTTWTADKAHSQISFGITHLGISEVEGLFRDFEASIVASEEDFSDARYEVEIDIASIDTGIERRDNHLRSSDFFDAENYPTMTFKSTSSKKVAEGKYKVTGDLHLHGMTKPITLDIWHRGTIKNPQSDGLISGFQITGTIDRTEFNIGDGFAEPMLSNKVSIKVDGEFKNQ